MKSVLGSLLAIGLTEVPKEIPFLTDEPKIPNYFCSPKNNPMNGYDSKESFGQGFDFNNNRARIKSIAETLERLCLYNQNGEIIQSGFIDDGSFVRPSDFNCYSEEQMPNLRKFLEELDCSSYTWVRAENLTTGKDIWTPAQTVFLYTVPINEMSLRGEQISTGGAFGKIGEGRAFKSGFLESIERDGIMNFYLNRQQGRKMCDFSPKTQELIDYLVRYQLETHIFDASSDFEIPTIFILTIDRTGIGEAVNIGSRSDLTYDSAIRGALMESIQCRRLSRTSASMTQANAPNENNINSLEERFLYWAEIERIADLDYMIDEEPTISYNGLKRKKISLKKAVNRVTSRGYNILVSDLTLPEVRRGGFETLKVVIPELHPMYLDERAKALHSKHYGEIKDDPTLKPHPVT